MFLVELSPILPWLRKSSASISVLWNTWNFLWSRYSIDTQALIRGFRPKTSKSVCEQTSWRTNRLSMPLDCFPSLFKVRPSGNIGAICSYPMMWINALTEWRPSPVLSRSLLGWLKCILIYSVFFPFTISASGYLSLKNDDYSFFYQK